MSGATGMPSATRLSRQASRTPASCASFQRARVPDRSVRRIAGKCLAAATEPRGALQSRFRRLTPVGGV